MIGGLPENAAERPPQSQRDPDRSDLRLNAPLMLQQFTNLSSGLALANARHSVVRRLTLISLSLGTVRLPLWPLLTFPPNLPCKITKVHISPWGFERTFPAQSLQK